MVVNTTLKTKSKTGYHFEYECNSGLTAVSGNLHRFCKENATLSGKAPLCTFVYDTCYRKDKTPHQSANLQYK